jgi:HK97 family phage prohead protease
MSHHKAFRLASFKAAGDGDAAGTFEALVSVFGNVDGVGDMVLPGAFTSSLKSWQDSGDPIPVVWNHQWEDPAAHIGYVNPADAQETDEGLVVRGQIDVGKPFAGQVYDLMKSRRVREMSFAYDVVSESKSKSGANELAALNLIEVGPTMKGVNPATQLLDVKSRPAPKAWVTLDGSHEDLAEQLDEAVEDWAEELGGWGYVEAVFDGYLIAGVDSMMEDETTFYQMTYTVAADESVTLGPPEQVELTAVVESVVKARRGARQQKSRRKAGRVLSAANEADLRSAVKLINGCLAQVTGSGGGGDSADSGDAKPADDSGKAMSPTTVRLMTALELVAV